MSAYANLEISLQRRSDGALAVEARYRPSASQTEAEPEGELLPLRIDEQALREARPDQGEYGRRLTAMVFADVRLRKLLAIARHDAAAAQVPLRLRLRLDADDEPLNALCWEALQDPDDEEGCFLAVNEKLLLSRFPVSSDPKPVVLPLRHDLEALVAVAAPIDLPRYRLAPIDTVAEIARAREALGNIPVRILARNSENGPLTLAALANSLREAPEILYLVCHGSMREGQPYLWLEDEEGNADQIRGDDLVALLNRLARRPLLVVLVSCQSSGDGAGQVLSAVGPRLATQGVAAVLAMQGSISMASAAVFSRTFFQELRRDGQIDRAVAAARGTIDNRPDWWMPVLLMRVHNGRLWAPVPAAQRLSSIQRVGALVAVALVALAAIAVLVIAVGPLLAAPPPMTGDFNVAVATFGDLDQSGRARPSPEGEALARGVYDALAANLPELGFHVELRSPAEMPRIAGTNPQERAANVAGLASAISADVIVYGNIADEGRSFVPEFYLSPRSIAAAEELIGQYSLGTPLTSPVDLRRNPVARGDLAAALHGRANALAQFVAGLGNYSLKRYDAALQHLRAADATVGWDPNDGKEVLYIFLGNAAGKLGDLDAAAGYYDQAAAVNPKYARALLGQAEVQLLRALGRCAPDDVDGPGLERAMRGFEATLAARDQPALADVAIKARFGLGRVFLCQSQALLADRWADAEAAFAEVLIEHEQRDNQRVKALAAQAQANLGFIYLPSGPDAPDAAERYRRAAEAYERALTLTDTDERGLRVSYYTMLGFIYGRLKEHERADQAYAAGLQLDPGNISLQRAREQLAAEVR